MRTLKIERKQRNDTVLTFRVVDAILKKVRRGQPYMKKGCPWLLLDYRDGLPKVSVSTYKSWLQRGNKPIDYKGDMTLRDMMQKAREERRERRIEGVIETAEQGLAELVAMPIDVPTRTERVHGENKITTICEGVSVPLVRVKLRAIKFALERLASEIYGKKGREVASAQSGRLIYG